MVWDVFLNRVLERSKIQRSKTCWGKNDLSKSVGGKMNGAGGAGRSWKEPVELEGAGGAGRSRQELAGAGRSRQEPTELAGARRSWKIGF